MATVIDENFREQWLVIKGWMIDSGHYSFISPDGYRFVDAYNAIYHQIQREIMNYQFTEISRLGPTERQGEAND